MTAREFARLIGVSQSAVSRAFTPDASISSDLRKKILDAADEHEYSPNAIASILSKSKLAKTNNNIVGIVFSELQNPFYPVLLEKLTRELQRVGQQSLMFNVTPGSDTKQQMTALRRYNVDAVIVVSATQLSGPDLNWATEGRRAVLVNRVASDASLASVCCDNAAGAREIADHFYALGHRRAAFVAGLPNTSTNLDRQHSFIARLAELGIRLTACVKAGSYAYEAGYRAALEIARTTTTDAIFFANDTLAIGGLDGLREEAGLKVPEDVSVAGFDDIAMAGWPRYALTTYRQPVDHIVDLAVRLISESRPHDARTAALHLVGGELVVRHSTAARDAPAGSGRERAVRPT
jgi:DNA-binding LacI/PurR family transcriptional regulator